MRGPGKNNAKKVDHNHTSKGKKATIEFLKLPKKEVYLKVEEALRLNKGFITQTADTLGISRSKLQDIMRDEKHWKPIMFDIKENISDKIEKLWIDNAMDLPEEKAFKWNRELAHMSRILKVRGWLQEPEIQINNEINFTFQLDDFDENKSVDDKND